MLERSALDMRNTGFHGTISTKKFCGSLDNIRSAASGTPPVKRGLIYLYARRAGNTTSLLSFY